MKNPPYIDTRMVFYVTIWVAVLTICGVWLFGLGQHNSLYHNAITSTTILSAAFFLFLTSGLYRGVRLKNSMEKLRDRLNKATYPNLEEGTSGADWLDVGDGIGGIILSVVFWLIATILIWVFLWFFGVVLWTVVLAFVAMLYWVFFRAMLMVFKHVPHCKNRLLPSAGYGLIYTILYMGWVYFVIIGTHLILE
ncbi:MAG TPA: hypothetical protein VK168_17835 [Saprospiraceae bacterium]|nr:hypothetical protein [Saprospiraceae bacterium]